MVRWLILLAVLLIAVPCQAAVLVQSANGQYSGAYKTLAAAAVAPGVTNVVVTSALSAVQSNISSATLHAWPPDRALEVKKGGSIGNTTTFTINGPFTAGLYQVFAGSGAVSGLKEAYPEWWGAKGDGIVDDSIALYKLALSVSNGTGTAVTFGAGKTYIVSPGTGGAFGLAFAGLSNLNIIGNNSTIKLKDGSPISTAWGMYFTGCTNVVVRDLNINGNRANITAGGADGGASGIAIADNNTGFLIDNVHITEMATDGLFAGIPPATGLVRPKNIKIINSSFTRSRRNNISLTGAIDVYLANNKITEAGVTSGSSTGTLPQYGIDLEPNGAGAAYRNEKIELAGNRFDANVIGDIILAGGSGGDNVDINIHNNVFTSPGIGIHLNSVVENNIEIKNNTFNASSWAILSSVANQSTNVTIANNKFNHTSLTVYAVAIDSSGKSEWVIANNDFYGEALHLSFLPISGDATSNRIFGNSYKFSSDAGSANQDAVTVNLASVSNELFAKPATRTNVSRYVVNYGVLADNIRVAGTKAVIYDSNIAFVLPSNLISKRNADHLEFYTAAPPVTGIWAVGSKALNNYFTVSGVNNCLGWGYTTIGWKVFGVVVP